MNIRKTRSAARMLMVPLAGTLLLSACSGKDNSSSNGSSSAPASTAAGSGSSASPAAVTYPLDTDTTLSYWYVAGGPTLAVNPDPNSWPFFQEWSKRTGVKLKVVTPAVNQQKEQLATMFASGDYTDVIEWNWLIDYPGGPEKAIKDGNILKLNDLIDKYAPNLKKYLQAHPDVDKQIKTDSGTYYGFPFIRGDDYLKTYGGPIIRKDWLDELGLEVPTTIDEWHTVLTAFKEKKGAAAPLTFQSVPRLFDGLAAGAFIGAFGVKRDFYMEDGKVKFGPMEPGYKDFLATMRQWYAEGLLDKDIATVDTKIQNADMTSGKSGATYALAGGGIGAWNAAGKASDPDFKVIGAPYPVLNKGDVPRFGQKDFSAPLGGFAAISPKSKHPEIAAQMLDYAYSDEGTMFMNFGTEGVSYHVVDGYPTYSDMIKKDYSIGLPMYTRATGGPMIEVKEYYEQFAGLPEQREAVVTWGKTDTDDYQLPPISPTPEESTEFAKIITEVNTLVDETTIRIVLGTDSLESYDTFLKKLKSLDIDRAIEIEQAALDRYTQR